MLPWFTPIPLLIHLRPSTIAWSLIFVLTPNSVVLVTDDGPRHTSPAPTPIDSGILPITP